MKYNKNQKLLFYNGGAWAIFDAFTSAFLVAFALLFGASNFVIGLLGATPYISALLIEIPGAKLAEYFSRKKIYATATGISRLFWILIILIPYFFSQNPLLFLVIFFTLIKITELASDPAWTSLAADIVPAKHRGAYFGKRNMLIGIAGMTAAVIAGYYLDIFPKHNYTGFSTLFATGIIFGLTATWLVSKIKEPKNIDHNHHTIKEFFTIKGEFKKFCTFAFFFYFAVMLASPFFAVYLLKNLNLSYTNFMLASAISTIARIAAQSRIGKLTDKYGDKQIGMISILGTAIVPFIFIFVTPQTMWLLIPAQIISGIMWAGADIIIFNLLLDLTEPQKRATHVATYAMLISVPNIIAPLIGGAIADYATLWILNGIPLLFFISFILRLSSSILLHRIKEPRAKKEYTLKHILHSVLRLHPSRGLEYRIRILSKQIKPLRKKLPVL
ncbi:MFS transporter [Candidatus Woesearchaeota archaeon]|nr:MFS transporter [Candidatus Woesearchaeota archaeon]